MVFLLGTLISNIKIKCLCTLLSVICAMPCSFVSGHLMLRTEIAKNQPELNVQAPGARLEHHLVSVGINNQN